MLTRRDLAGWLVAAVALASAAGCVVAFDGGGAVDAGDTGDEDGGDDRDAAGRDGRDADRPDAGAGDPPDAGADDPGPGAACTDYPHQRVVDVGDADELEAALDAAGPGDLIQLAAGTYGGRFTAATSGSAAAPITLCGPRAATLDGGGGGYVLHVTASHWVIAGLTVTAGQKGIMLDGASENVLTDLLVHDIGQEAVHFRDDSSDNLLRRSEVRDTGSQTPGFGEGVYIGSATSNWCNFDPGCAPDRSDRNQVIDCTIAATTAENIDIKEGTTGGVVRGNRFDGAGTTGDNFADSWLDVKGNGYVVEANLGVDARLDGFQVHVIVDGWGQDNVFRGNDAQVNGPGLGFNIQDEALGTVVACDNEVTGAAAGFANVDCQ